MTERPGRAQVEAANVTFSSRTIASSCRLRALRDRSITRPSGRMLIGHIHAEDQSPEEALCYFITCLIRGSSGDAIVNVVGRNQLD